MATYFLSNNPVISNFGENANVFDTFNVDTASSNQLQINQVGTNVTVSDGTHTATFQNFTLEQLSNYNGNLATNGQLLNTFDGSQIIIGTAGNDYIFDFSNYTQTNSNNYNNNTGSISSTNDYLRGLAGNDSIGAGYGNDVIYGNQGNDTIGINDYNNVSGNDTMYGGQGTDVINLTLGLDPDGDGFYTGFTDTGNNVIYGNLGNDSLTGGSGNDKLYGGQGDDSIAIGMGAKSSVYGGQGNDLIVSGTSAGSTSLIYGNQGADQISAGNASGKDTVYGGQGNDVVDYRTVNGTANAVGTAGTTSALIYGNLGDDQLFGSSGNDTIYGGQGNDYIVGGAGADTLSGGLGNDTFVGTDINNTGTTTATADVITDFVTGSDKIELNVAGTNSNFTAIDATGSPASVGTVTSATGAESFSQTYNGGNIATGTYEFIAGQTDGYLIDNSAGGGDAVTVLKGANNIADLKFSDIIAGSATVPGANGTV